MINVPLEGELEERIRLLAQVRNLDPLAQALELIEFALSQEERYEVYKTSHPPGAT
jgi:hypothetical protein